MSASTRAAIAAMIATLQSYPALSASVSGTRTRHVGNNKPKSRNTLQRRRREKIAKASRRKNRGR